MVRKTSGPSHGKGPPGAGEVSKKDRRQTPYMGDIPEILTTVGGCEVGFRDFAKGVAWVGMVAVQTTYEDAQRKMERIERYKERYDRLDDETLMRKYKSASSGEARMACGMLLKERGYGSQD